MTKKFILPFLFLSVSLLWVSCKKEQKKEQAACNYITDYYPKIYKADLAFEKENYQKAYDLYQDAFKGCPPKMTPHYNEMEKLAKASAQLKEYETTYTCAQKLIKKGVDLDFFENWRVFQVFLDTAYGDSLFSNYTHLRHEFETHTKFDIRQKIIKMKEEDTYYHRYPVSEQWQKTDSIDRLHGKELKIIFEKYGFPNRQLIGPYAYDHKEATIDDLLIHTSDSLRMHYFLPKLREFVKEGKAPPRILATVVDHYRLSKGKEQKFGIYLQPDGRYTRLLKDRDQVDRNRREIGMPTLRQERLKDSLMLDFSKD